MAILVKFILLALFASVIFFRQYFPNDILYWSAYFVMFGLVGLYWYFSFWVSEKKASRIIGEKPCFSVFAGKVSAKAEDDLERGRLCIVNGKLILIHKKDGLRYIKSWELPVNEITSIGYGVVAGRRRGFTVYYGKNSEVSFTCSGITKKKEELYRALGWDFDK